MINSERDGYCEDLYTSLDIVHNWSQHRNPSNINRKYFHEIPILGTKERKNAYFWVESKPWVLKGNLDGDFQLFFVKLSSYLTEFFLNKTTINSYNKFLAKLKHTTKHNRVACSQRYDQRKLA